MSGTAMMDYSRPTAARGLPRLLASSGADLTEHLRTHGPLPCLLGRTDPDGLIEEIGSAGLTGRGGAAFPAAVKMTAVARRAGGKVVVGNGAEGEPASH